MARIISCTPEEKVKLYRLGWERWRGRRIIFPKEEVRGAHKVRKVIFKATWVYGGIAFQEGRAVSAKALRQEGGIMYLPCI